METFNKIFTEEEYLMLESQSATKSEYHAGEVVSMAGASLAHNLVVKNLIVLLSNCLEEKDCTVLPSDMLLKLEKCEKYVYPDVTIICDKIRLAEQKHRGLDVLLNPSVIVEVSSSTTFLYDNTEKMQCYLKLQSLQQYVLVDSEKISATTYTKKESEGWIMQHKDDITTTLKIMDCNLFLKQIYQQVF